VRLRVLSWNLMHGRSVPSSGRDLFDDFAAALDRWPWDVALLQEVPPWWPPALSPRLGAEYRQVLTSRNGLPAIRRAIAQRWPDVIKSNGGGANAILARRDRIIDARAQRLCRLPERRWAHGVRLASGIWLVNLHATAHDDAGAERDGEQAAAAAARWAGGGPVILGGDFNLRTVEFDGFRHAAWSDVDHLFIGGPLEDVGGHDVLDRRRLSDHAPVTASVGWETDEDGPEPNV
jgi:endonuclease/exonuclease/phosphatase family metal-dependent hydrolase